MAYLHIPKLTPGYSICSIFVTLKCSTELLCISRLSVRPINFSPQLTQDWNILEYSWSSSISSLLVRFVAIQWNSRILVTVMCFYSLDIYKEFWVHILQNKLLYNINLSSLNYLLLSWFHFMNCFFVRSWTSSSLSICFYWL